MGSNARDLSHNRYGMDFGGVTYGSDTEPDPMDSTVATMIRLTNEEQNRRTGRNDTLDVIEVTNIGNNIRMFSEPGPDPRFMTFYFPDEISTKDVEAFQQYLRNSGKFSAGATLPPIEPKCNWCGESPCFLNQVVEGTGGRTMYEHLFVDKGDAMVEQGIATKEIRYALYRDATTFISGYLGKGNRKQLPACVVGEIQDSFPAPQGGTYTGFKNAGSK